MILIAPSSEQEMPQDVEALLWVALGTMSVKDAAAHVAKATGLARHDVYSQALQMKDKQ